MADAPGETYRAQFTAIDERLTPALDAAEREAIKRDIYTLFKTVEQQIAELGALREDIKSLVDKWKSLPPPNGTGPVAGGNGRPPGAIPRDAATMATPAAAAPASAPTHAPQLVGEKPTVHADHLGASTFIEKGWSRISLGDYPAAEAALVKALELAPNDPQSESLLGWAQMLQAKYDDALLNFQKVLMRQPANALARINVGYICLKKGIFGEAIEHLSKAIRLDNDRKAVLYAHFYLGLVYLEREMYEDAQTFFLKTLAIGPNLIEAYFELGRAQWFDGQRERAMQTWRDGAAANKFNPWGKRCAELLQTVESGGEPPRTS